MNDTEYHNIIYIEIKVNFRHTDKIVSTHQLVKVKLQLRAYSNRVPLSNLYKKVDVNKKDPPPT